MSKPRLEDLPPRYQAQARAQLSEVPHPKTVSAAAVLAPARPVRATMRQQVSDGMNKLERAFHATLTRNPVGRVLTQSVTLKIANGCRYTPDFIEVPTDSGIRAYEVKGFMRDDAGVKLKVAAALFPWIKFHLVTRKAGNWRVEEILP